MTINNENVEALCVKHTGVPACNGSLPLGKTTRLWTMQSLPCIKGEQREASLWRGLGEQRKARAPGAIHAFQRIASPRGN